MMSTLGLGFVLTAKDLASGAVTKLRDNLKDLHKEGTRWHGAMQASFKAFDLGAATAAVGAATLGGAFALATKGDAFTQAITNAGVATKASAADMEALAAAAQDTGLIMKGASFEEQAATLQALGREGMNAKDAITQLRPAIELAALTGRSGAEAAGFLADAVAGFGGSAEDAQKYVNQMAIAMQKFGIGSGEIEAAVMPLTGAAKSIGMSFRDTLTLTGIINSQLGSMGKSSAAAMMAINQLTDPKTATHFQQLGVEVKNADGSYRSLLEILGDTAEATKGLTDAERSEKLASILGARAAQGMGIVVDQLSKGVEDASGKLVTGAAAVKALADEMERSNLVADIMSSKMMSTLGGQMTVLQKAMDSLATTIGVPLAEAFTPIVQTIGLGIVRIIDFVKGIPGPVKRFLAVFTIGFGAAATAVGAFLASSAAIAMFSASISAIGSAAAGLAAFILPAAAAVGVLGAAFYGLKQAYDANVGGLYDTIQNGVEKVKLAFDAFGQVFSQGGFSGKVREALNEADNAGLKTFVIRVFSAVERVKHFFGQIGAAVATGIENARPTFEAMSLAFDRLGAALGALAPSADGAAGRWAAAGAMGAKVGTALAKVIELVAAGLTIVADVGTGVVMVWDALSGAFGGLSEAAGDVGSALGEITGALGLASTGAASGTTFWQALGSTLGTTVALAARLAASTISAVATVVSNLAPIISGVVDVIGGIFEGNWSRVWDGLAQVAFGAAQAVIDTVLGMAQIVADTIDTMAKAVGKNSTLGADLKSFRADAKEFTKGAFGMAHTERDQSVATAQTSGVGSQAFIAAYDRAPLYSPAMVPASAQAQAAASGVDPSAYTAAVKAGLQGSPAAVVAASIYLDGEKVGEANMSVARRDANARGDQAPLGG